ncbi:glycoside hydrolase family 2 protein [Phytoactinopolyspora alkaliphila]|uniref:Glycoside hydrolase family 2 protein n=1 Tax=Phytoactinopolyspora alkaliphila TaxID=1783498 RepID=A0A6N9YTM9_9ACTN|nr:glycoside hydrolase family 2 TIM barrel-domain containing protein [Phytoactinopolyspora alkaliphila]NED98396.1 glycoside hydrolase family 2 protein [Phytoactinopolyspora alkaliphila]
MSEQTSTTGATTRRQIIRGGATLGVGLLAAGVGSATAGTAIAYAADDETQDGRARENFDFGWKFLRDDPQGAQAPSYDDAGWDDVDLPHDWSIEGPLSPSEPSGGPGGWVPTGIGWYRKRFTAPTTDADRRVVVDFDGVYQNSSVWINGKHLGDRPYGYVPFAYDLTPHLVEGENVIAVRVDNSRQPNSRWYSGSGIYRHTWLTTTHAVHIAQWGTQVIVEEASAEAATLRIKTVVENEGERPAQVTLQTDLIDADGKTVETVESARNIPHGREHTFSQELAVDDPALWSVEDPTMYTIRSTVRTGSGSGRQTQGVVDVYDTPIGIRTAVFDADKGLLINGQQVKMNGVNIHHEAGLVGAAVPVRVWERRLELLKEMGCNAIRTGHTPFAAEVLDLFDRMGFLVMNEVLDEWKAPKPQVEPNGYSAYFDEWYERDIVNVVRRDRNRPSVVLWSAGNEVADQSPEGDPDGHHTLRSLVEVFHREDPIRLVTVGCDRMGHERPGAATTDEFIAEMDVIGYNYCNRWRDRAHLYMEVDRKKWGHKPMVGSESGNITNNHSVDVENQYKFISTRDYASGDFMWTGFDYLGEASSPNSRGFSGGVMNLCGFKKPGFYFYQSQWTEEPMVYLFPHWNQNAQPGQRVTVRAYTNCDSVELFLNGRSLGTKGYWHPAVGMVEAYNNYPPERNTPRTTSDLSLAWDVPYEPGTLRAVGRKLNNVAVTTEVTTTSGPAAIRLSVDRDKIAADRRDVAHITAEIVDANGLVVPTANNRVTWSVQGNGTYLGSDNGNMSDRQDYRLEARNASQGRLLAIVQSADEPGTVSVSASSPGLTAASVEFQTVS